MKFEPKEVDAEVNLPQRHPLADLVWLGGGLLAIMVTLYLSAGLVVDYLARFIPPEYDNTFSGTFDEQLLAEFGEELVDGELVTKTQALFDQLRAELPADDTREYTLTIIDTPQVNAMALPGAHIVVLRGLLDEAQSENEVAMVLAHEFGHIYHRHHWRKLGRAAIFTVAATLAGSSQASLHNQVMAVPLTTLMQANSRSHESESDRFALNVMCQFYGHSGGTTDFFNRHTGDSGRTQELISFLQTHPLSETRVADIERQAITLNCLPDNVEDWPFSQPETP